LDRLRLAEYPDQLALYQKGLKVLFRPERVLAFRLGEDPLEEEDLEARERRLTRRILQAAEKLREAPLGADPENENSASGPNVTSEMESELRALGY
jgi:hypothetical protein